MPWEIRVIIVTMACPLPPMTGTTIIIAVILYNCAVWAKGGWWHNTCHNSNLNGLYGDNRYSKGVNWEDWKTLEYSLKSSVMKVRKP